MGLGQSECDVMNQKGKLRSILFISVLDYWLMGSGKSGSALYQTLTGYAKQDWKVTFIASAVKQNILHEGIEVMSGRVPIPNKLHNIPKVGYFFRLIWLVLFSLIAIAKGVLIVWNKRPNIFYGYGTQGVLPAWFLSRVFHKLLVSRYQGTTLKLNWIRKKFNRLRVMGDILAYKIPTNLIIMTNDGSQGNKVLEESGVNMEHVRFWVNDVYKAKFNKFSKEETKRELKISTSHVLLTVSRLLNWKHVDRSIRALPTVVKEFPDVELIIVGGEPEREKLIGTFTMDLTASEEELWKNIGSKTRNMVQRRRNIIGNQKERSCSISTRSF